MESKNIGKVVQIVGAVVDIRFGAHGDARHGLRGFGAAALDPVGDDP